MADERAPSPAYVPYTTFKSTIRSITHDKKPPTRIDKTVLSKMSGSGQHQFLGTLRFLNLIDDKGIPSQRLVDLCAADDTHWKAVLAPALREKYAVQLAALKDGTLGTFRESFGDLGGIVIPAMRFLHAAAKDVGIPISGHIKEIPDPRPSNRKSGEKSKKPNEQIESKPTPDISAGFRDKLLEKFPEFDPSWDDTKQTAWFTAFNKFMAMTGQGGDE